jgi:CheY-like chemotaxis protein
MAATTTVLHVDDDPELLGLSSSVLQNDGRFEAITAESAVEGLERLSETQVDCVVSDSVRCPDGDAFVNVVGREYPEIPVILFTAKEPAAVTDELRGESVTEYVRKAGKDDFQILLTHLSRVADDSPSLDAGGRADRDFTADEQSTASATADTDATADETDADTTAIPDLGPDWSVVGLHDWEDPEDLTASVVAAVAALTNTEMEELPPLYPKVDPEAVAGVVCPRADGRYRHGVQVQFPYVGYDCLVTGGGAVAVREQGVEA